MSKIQKNLLIYLITIFFLWEFLLNSNYLITVFFNTINLCINNLFPSIFIFFTITDILHNYNLPYYISKTIGATFEKIFKIPKVGAYIVSMSFTSGFPGNAKLIKEQLDKKAIDKYDATKLLTMTHFANPLFVIFTVGNTFFHDKKIGIIILIIHFITNIIIGLLFRNIFKYEKKDNYLKPNTPLSFIDLLKNSFNNTFKILITVFGIILFMALITTTINHYLNLHSFSNCLFNGLIEITTGLKYLSLLNIEKAKACALATFFISFGGLSIHMQIISILNKYDVNYYIYLISRILHGTISSILVYLILIYYK